MKDSILKKYIEDMKYEDAIEYIVNDIIEMATIKLKQENSDIDFEPTLSQLYLMTDAKSQVNNIAGMVIEVLENNKLKQHEKLKVLMEDYEFAKSNLMMN